MDNSGAGADYTGLTMGTDSDGRTLLYAANLGQGTVDVFDAAFLPTHTIGGSFTDNQLPDGFVPYNIQNLGGKLYVTYTKQGGDTHVGDGFVDVFSTDGTLLQRLVANGPLNAPWGVAIAPTGFGVFSNDLLVGNVADGHINAFDPTTGAFVSELKDGLGNPIAIDGLWALHFGNGGAAGDTNTLFFNAGIGGYQHGLFGSLQIIDPIMLSGSDGGAGAPSAALRIDLTTLPLRGDVAMPTSVGAFTGSTQTSNGAAVLELAGSPDSQNSGDQQPDSQPASSPSTTGDNSSAALDADPIQLPTSDPMNPDSLFRMK